MANPNKQNCMLADRAGNALISTQQALIADAIVNYATPGLDTEAELIVAFNATNAKLNAILDILEAHGLMSAT